jgi:hypothetical protein
MFFGGAELTVNHFKKVEPHKTSPHELALHPVPTRSKHCREKLRRFLDALTDEGTIRLSGRSPPQTLGTILRGTPPGRRRELAIHRLLYCICDSIPTRATRLPFHHSVPLARLVHLCLSCRLPVDRSLCSEITHLASQCQWSDLAVIATLGRSSTRCCHVSPHFDRKCCYSTSWTLSRSPSQCYFLSINAFTCALS